MTAVVELNPELIIGRGLHRVCYVHPQDDDKCIKVIVQGDGSETEREIAYYQLLQKRNISWAMLPKYYGSVTTNEGKGFVYELIKDADGSVAETLESYFAYDHLLNEAKADTIVTALKKLYTYLIAENIITMNIKAKNIVYQRQDSEVGTLFIVDNIGNSDYLPLASYLPLLGKAKIKRKWQRFLTQTGKDFADKPEVIALLKQLR